MTTVEVLREARALYEANPDHTPYGGIQEPDHFCLIGACNQSAYAVAGCLDADYWNTRAALLARLAAATGAGNLSRHLIGWNATHSTEEVLAAFDRAIAALAGS